MTDIIKRLREMNAAARYPIAGEAADEIKQLRAALADAKTLACTSWPNCPVDAETERCAKIAMSYEPSCPDEDMGQTTAIFIAAAIREQK